MSGHEETLRKLAIRDDACLASLLADDANMRASHLDPKTHSLVRVAALVAMDATTPSYLWTVEAALRHGATAEEIVGTLIAVLPAIGSGRVVSAAPKLAIAIGYDVNDGLEDIDSDPLPLHRRGRSDVGRRRRGAGAAWSAAVLIVVAVILLLVLPGPWNVIAAIGALLLWGVEVYFINRTVRRRRQAVGDRTLIGREAVVTAACEPDGQVRLDGETWAARCEAGAQVGESVRIVGRDGLTLVVEPVGSGP